MKPSDRIAERCRELGRIPYGGWDYGALEMVTAVVEYLDEQQDLERRRNAFRNALAMIGPGCDIDAINDEVVNAELVAMVYRGDSYRAAKVRIVDAAREAGLL